MSLGQVKETNFHCKTYHDISTFKDIFVAIYIKIKEKCEGYFYLRKKSFIFTK